MQDIFDIYFDLVLVPLFFLALFFLGLGAVKMLKWWLFRGEVIGDSISDHAEKPNGL